MGTKVIRTLIAAIGILLLGTCEGTHSPNQRCVNEDTRLLGTWFGSLGWGASAGNGGGVGRVFPYWSYRWQADRSGKIERIRFNLPRRPGYFGGSGGILRLTVRKNNNTRSSLLLMFHSTQVFNWNKEKPIDSDFQQSTIRAML